MENLLKAILLGAIQGIAEWLPISSTGHLRLAEYFLLQQRIPILFDVSLHIGTLIVIFIFFRKEIKSILSALIHWDFETEYGRIIPLIVVGSISTALIGLAIGDVVESTFAEPGPIGVALILCGLLLFSSRFAAEKSDTITYKDALLFGTAQGLSIIPGLSRSGTTIAVALLLGLKREKAFKFSFLLSVPAIIGALGLTVYKQHAYLAQSGFGPVEVFAGAAVAMLVGYVALRILHRVVRNEKFHLFAFYCWLLGSALIVSSLVGF